MIEGPVLRRIRPIREPACRMLPACIPRRAAAGRSPGFVTSWRAWIQQTRCQRRVPEGPASLTSDRDFPQDGLRQFAMTNYAAAGAFEVTPRVAVGGALNVYTFDLTSDFRRLDADGFFGPPIPATQLGRSTQTGNDVGVAPTVGIRACVKDCADRSTPALRGGFVYRHGPTFDFDTQDGPNQRTNIFRVPHVFAFGAAYEVPQPGRRLLFLGEVTHITNSRLVSSSSPIRRSRPVWNRTSSSTTGRSGISDSSGWPRTRAGCRATGSGSGAIRIIRSTSSRPVSWMILTHG